MPIKYPTEFKVKAIRRYEKGESIKELCKELNISQSTLYHWRKQYCSIQTDTRTYTPAEFTFLMHFLNCCNSLGLNNPFPQPSALMTMLLQKRFSQHLRRKKPIGGNIHLKSTSVKVWMSIFAFTMKSGHIKP